MKHSPVSKVRLRMKNIEASGPIKRRKRRSYHTKGLRVYRTTYWRPVRVTWFGAGPTCAIITRAQSNSLEIPRPRETDTKELTQVVPVQFRHPITS